MQRRQGQQRVQLGEHASREANGGDEAFAAVHHAMANQAQLIQPGRQGARQPTGQHRLQGAGRSGASPRRRLLADAIGFVPFNALATALATAHALRFGMPGALVAPEARSLAIDYTGLEAGAAGIEHQHRAGHDA